MSAKAGVKPGSLTAKPTGLDGLVSGAAALIGISLISTAVSANPRAFVLIAGLEGSVVIMLVAGVLASIAGLRARVTLGLLVPIIGLKLLLLRHLGTPWLAPIGAELAGIGAVSFLATWVRGLMKR